jgi:hypothetical protein
MSGIKDNFVASANVFYYFLSYGEKTILWFDAVREWTQTEKVFAMLCYSMQA